MRKTILTIVLFLCIHGVHCQTFDFEKLSFDTSGQNDFYRSIGHDWYYPITINPQEVYYREGTAWRELGVSSSVLISSPRQPKYDTTYGLVKFYALHIDKKGFADGKDHLEYAMKVDYLGMVTKVDSESYNMSKTKSGKSFWYYTFQVEERKTIGIWVLEGKLKGKSVNLKYYYEFIPVDNIEIIHEKK